MGEKITITSYDGHAINDGSTYSAYFLAEDEPLSTFESSIIQAEVAGDFPNYVRGQPGGRVYPLKVKVLGTPSLANIRTLKAWMTPYADEVYLKGTDTASVAWRLKVKCLQLVPWEKQDGIFVARLYAPEPLWEQDSEQSDTQADLAASPADWTLTPAGSARCYPTFEFTPTVSKNHANYWKRRRHIIIANTVERTLTSTNGLGYPIDVFNDALDAAAIIAASQMQNDGDDVRLFVDGQLVTDHVGSDRWFQDLDSETAQMWGNLSYSPGKIATLDGAMTDADPANGESIAVDNAAFLAGWPESGFFKIGDECIYYASRTLTSFDQITRAVRGTTAAAHNDAVSIYWVEHEVYFEYDFTAATAGPGPDDTKPVISLASTNAGHDYPGPFMAPTTLRTGQLLDDYREINDLSPYMSREDTAAALKFIDSPAEAGKPQSVGAVLYVPCGVDTAAASLEQDVTVPANLLCRAYGSDEEGNETLLAEWNPDTDGANEQITPSGVLTRLRYAAMVRTVTAAEPPSLSTASGVLGVSGGNAHRAQKFTLDQTCTIQALSVKLKRVSGEDGDVVAHLYHGGADPEAGMLVVFALTICAASAIGTADFSRHDKALAAPITVPAGDYYLVLYRSASAGTIYWGYAAACYAKGSMWTEAAGVWTETGNDFWFRILGDGSVCQDEVPSGTDEEGILDNIEINFDSPPYVKVSAAEEIYAYAGRLENLTTGQYIDVWGSSKLNETLIINCATKAVTGGELGLSCLCVVDFSDEKDGIHLNPGANSMRWIEPTIGTVTIGSKWRGRWS